MKDWDTLLKRSLCHMLHLSLHHLLSLSPVGVVFSTEQGSLYIMWNIISVPSNGSNTGFQCPSPASCHSPPNPLSLCLYLYWHTNIHIFFITNFLNTLLKISSKDYFLCRIKPNLLTIIFKALSLFLMCSMLYTN